MIEMILPSLDDNNAWADFWRYKIGVNIIPAKGKLKKTFIHWSPYQKEAISEEQHNKWKTDNEFKDGMAVIMGKVWHRKDKEGYYCVGADVDNAIAIKEIIQGDNLPNFASKTLVEQYEESPDRLHFYLYSPRAIINKGSDVNNPAFTKKLDNNELPKIEIKCQERILYCTPSPNANGKPRRIIGTREPKTLDDANSFEAHINDICKKYGLTYLNGNAKSNLTPIEDLFKPGFKVTEGHNRHEALLRAMDSLLKRNCNILPKEEIKQLAIKRNNELCSPPLNDREFEKQWKSAIKFIAKNKTDNDSNQEEAENEDEKKKQKVFIRKYTGNGTLALHESAVVGGQSTFLCLTGSLKPQYIPDIETTNKILHPADTNDTQNPIPYIFQSVEDLNHYLDLASKETFETLFTTVETIFRKYVNAEDHYITILSADIIYSYFQDKFGTTHYNLFVGDNGSGKNSALLVDKYLGYRVFYGLGISAPNYFTFLGDIEEGQGSIAEDEAEDMGYDKEKQKIIKGGYCSGATVPKVDLSFGRRQDAWLTYCHKWYAMEELPEYKKIKGILDRSFVYNFVVGRVPHNIKDVIRCAGDLEYKALYDELVHTRKLLFCVRLLRHQDIIPEIKLNIIHRNAELTKPLLRLFSYRNDAPIALNKIRLALSKFILGKNESKKNSIESKMYETIKNIHKRREEYKKDNNEKEWIEYEGLESRPYGFYNGIIWAELKDLMDGEDIPKKPHSFYSPEYGVISYKRITGLYRSKLKANQFVARGAVKTERGLEFSKEVLDKLDLLYYEVPNEIIIEEKSDTLVTDITLVGRKEGAKNKNLIDGVFDSHAQVAVNTYCESESTDKDGIYTNIQPVTTVTKQIHTPQQSVTSVISVTKLDNRFFYMKYIGHLTKQGIFKKFPWEH